MCEGINSRCSSGVSGVAPSGWSKTSPTLVPEKPRIGIAHDLVQALSGVLRLHGLVFEQHGVLDRPLAPLRKSLRAGADHGFQWLVGYKGVDERAIERLRNAAQ